MAEEKSLSGRLFSLNSGKKEPRERLFSFIKPIPQEKPAVQDADIKIEKFDAPLVKPPIQPDIKIEIKPQTEVKTEAKPVRAETKPEPQKPIQEDVFLTNIFEKKTASSPLESKMIKSLVESEEKEVEKKRSILGAAPEIDTKLFIDIEYHLKKKLSAARGVFFGLAALFLLIIASAYSVLDSSYGFFYKNIGVQFDEANQKLQNKQTDVNKIHYENIKHRLDLLLYNGNLFLQKYYEHKFAGSENQGSARSELDAAKKEVADLFDELSSDYTNYKNYQELASGKTMSPEEAEAEFDNKARELLLSELDKNPEYKDTAAIIGDKSLIEIFKNKKSSDMQSDEDYLKMLQNISSKYTGKLASFYKIRNSRIKWDKYLDEINKITSRIDPDYSFTLFGSDFALGAGIKYTSFNIEGENKIKISGIAVSSDGKTFSILANLIDEFNKLTPDNKPGAFLNAEMKIFSKNADAKDSKYTSSFTITADLNPNI